MRSFTIGLFLCSISLASSQAMIGGADSVEVESCSASAYKDGYCVTYGKDANLPNYAPDAIVFTGSYKDNKKEGPWQHFFPNGKIKNEIIYKSNRPNGYAKFYNQEGVVVEEGIWNTSKWVGSYVKRYDDGTISNQWNHNERGKREGTQTDYHPNGNKRYEFDMQGGRKNGWYREWDEKGNLLEETLFEAGTVKERKVVKVKEEVVVGDPDIEIEPVHIEADTMADDNTPPVVRREKLDGYYQDYNRTTGQLKRDGLFKAGVFQDGWIYTYETTTDKKCSTKVEIKNFRRIRELECEYEDGGMLEKNPNR